MLSALADTKRNGGSVVSINPLLETGLNRFKHPQKITHLIGRGTAIADAHYPVRIGGDQALLQGVAKVVLEAGKCDWDFIDEHTEGFEAWKDSIEQVSWNDIVTQSGIPEAQIRELGEAVANSERMIICWAMGITQHENAVATIQEIANLLLIGGHFAKPGAGACPVRGHSNVQGDRTVGIDHNPSAAFLEALERVTGIQIPREPGFDTVEFVHASRRSEVKLLMALGGNLLSAMSDTEAVAEAIENIDLTVQISTKLNRSHLVTGKTALILPCLGRTELDPAGFVSVENSMSVVHRSTGHLSPASPDLLSEPAIVCGIGTACFGSEPFDWGSHTQNHDSIRDLIQNCLPEFSDYNQRVRDKGGFYLPNGPRDGPTWDTPSSKAVIHTNPLPVRHISEDRFILMTVRSHDQYNTTIYGNDDRYRGIYNARRIIMMNKDDMKRLQLEPQAIVDLTSHHKGRELHSDSWKVVPYDIPKGNLAAYFPEANVLVPLDSVAKGSNTPTSKWIEVSLQPHN
jgi:molybdopterin-dependent oxidoreductase alpha subunit